MTIYVPWAKKQRLCVVKPVYAGTMPMLDDARIAANAARGCETVMVLDANVLGQIHEFAMKGGSREYLAELGLDQLIGVLVRPHRQALVLAAGVGFQELPPPMLHGFERAFEWFVNTHLPGYGDHPLILPPRLSTPRLEPEFWDKAYDSQVALALSYAHLLLLQIVMMDDSEKSALARFQRFVDLVVAETDVLGAKEMEVARWCLSPIIDKDLGYRDRRLAVIRNFTRFGRKPPRSGGELKHVALNGAHDLWMITSAAYMEARGLGGVPQDMWLLTYDEKFAAFCEVFGYAPAGAFTGSMAVCTRTPSDHDPGYWEESAKWIEGRQRKRGWGRGRDHDAVSRLQLVRRCEALAEAVGRLNLANAWV